MQPDNPVFASRVSSGDSRPFLPLTGHSVFWPGALLALALLIYKAALLTTINGWSIGLILLHPLFLQMPAYQDLAFAFTVTASFGIAMAASYRWPSVRRGLWWVFLSFCTACVLFAVICFPIFKYLHVPLTLGLLHATGSLSGAATSVAGYVSPWEIAAVVILPLVYLVLSLILATYLPSTSTGRSMAVYIALAGLVLGLWLVGSRRISTDKWAFNGSQAIAMNPQWVMLDSLYHDLIAPNAIAQKSDFPQEYLADFSLARLILRPTRLRRLREGPKISYSSFLNPPPRSISESTAALTTPRPSSMPSAGIVSSSTTVTRRSDKRPCH